MSRRRYISTQVSIDRAVNELAVKRGDFAALLYTWMIPHAADDCTVPADAGELLVTVVPWRRDKSEQDVQHAIDAMLELHLLERCEDPRWLRFPPESFYRYQSYIKLDRQSPAPAAQNSAEQRNSPQNIASFSVSSSHIDSVTDSSDGAAAPMSPVPMQNSRAAEVREIWDYFKATIQPKARECPSDKIKALLKSGYTVDDLKDALDRFKANYWWFTHNRTQRSEWFFKSKSRIEGFSLLEPQTQEEYEAEQGGHRPNNSRSGDFVMRGPPGPEETQRMIATYGVPQ